MEKVGVSSTRYALERINVSGKAVGEAMMSEYKEYKRHKNGGGLVATTAMVCSDCYIGQNAKVSGNARVLGKAAVFDRANVYGEATVYGSAKISGDALVFGSALVGEKATVCEDAVLYGNAMVSGCATISGYAEISGSGKVRGSAIVSGDSKLFLGIVTSGKTHRGTLAIQGGKHVMCVSGPGHITIGCQTHPVRYWRDHEEELMLEHQPSPEDAYLYKSVFPVFAQFAEEWARNESGQ